MLKDRLMSMMRGPRAPAESAHPASTGGSPKVFAKPAPKTITESRPSRGLDQFFGAFRDQTGLSILDLGGAFQENVNFITSLGHRFYSEDFLRLFQESFGEVLSDQANSGRIEYFLRQSLEYPDETFDGVLAWDVLEYMEPPLLAATADRLLRVLKPEGYLLAFFRAEDKEKTVPYYTFRIQDVRTLQVTHHGSRTITKQPFNNRGLEKLFHNFQSVKFFLTRERLREVIVRK